MTSRLTALLLVLLAGPAAGQAQGTRIGLTAGISVPTGAYAAESDLDPGDAAPGPIAGLQLLFPLDSPRWLSVQADIAMILHDEDDAFTPDEPNDIVGHWVVVPLTLGTRLERRMESTTVFVTPQFGLALAMGPGGKAKDVPEGVLTETWSPAPAFVLGLGAGAVLGGRVQFGLRYSWLGDVAMTGSEEKGTTTEIEMRQPISYLDIGLTWFVK